MTATQTAISGLPVAELMRAAKDDGAADVWVRVRDGLRSTALMPTATVEYDERLHMLVVDLGAYFETGHVAAAINPALTETVEDLNVLLIEAGAA